MYAPWNTGQQEWRNVNEQILHNLGRIHGNGKEKAHKAMSELLEKILSNDNMNAAYLERYQGANQATGVQTPAGQEGRNTQAERRSEETRNPDRNGQGNSARYCTGHKPHV